MLSAKGWISGVVAFVTVRKGSVVRGIEVNSGTALISPTFNVIPLVKSQ